MTCTFCKVALVLSFILAAAYLEAECPSRVYVSTSGNSAWTGRLAAPNTARRDGPLASLDDARDRIRELHARGCAGVTHVVVRGGNYRLSKTFELTSEDSGTQSRPVVYEAYPGEHPIVSGGREITGWAQDDSGIRSAKIDRPISQLFVNGTRAQRARVPYDGYLRAEGKSSSEQHYQLHYKGNDIQPEWAGSGAEVVVLLAWAEMRRTILSVDSVHRIATLSGAARPSTHEESARYWVENAPNESLGNGEWRTDTDSHIIYYRPRKEDEDKSPVVTAPFLTQLVVANGDQKAGSKVHDIVMRGFDFEEGAWTLPEGGYADSQAARVADSAIQIRDSKRIRLIHCTFRSIGGYAIHIRQGSSKNEIVHSAFYDLGGGAIRVGEERVPKDDAERVWSNNINDNDIHSIGLVYSSAVAIWVGQSDMNSISHNHIHDIPYGAISVGWTWGYGPSAADRNIIQYNWIHDIGTVLSDLGGVYLLGRQPGTIVGNNLIYNVGRFTYGGWGIYLDEGTSNIVVENNVVYDAQSAGFHQHYGRDNIVRNNIFAFGHEYQLMRTKPESTLSFRFEHNIVLYEQGSLLGYRWHEGGYEMDWNLYWDLRGQAPRFGSDSWESWRNEGYDLHSAVADPKFTNVPNRDFRLLSGSPAIGIGFHPIDLSTVGPRTFDGNERLNR